MKKNLLTDIAKLLSDETRVRILEELHRHGDMCVYEIAEAVNASQSATSHQLAKLETQGIVRCYRDGQKMCYELLQGSKTSAILQVFALVQ